MKKLLISMLAIAVGSALVSCSDSDNDEVPVTPEERAPYSAEIKYTEFGVPHITADNYAAN